VVQLELRSFLFILTSIILIIFVISSNFFFLAKNNLIYVCVFSCSFLSKFNFIYIFFKKYSQFFFVHIFFCYLIMQLLILYQSIFLVIFHIKYFLIVIFLLHIPYFLFFGIKSYVFNYTYFSIVCFVGLTNFFYVSPISILLLLSDFSFLLYSLFPGVFFYLPSSVPSSIKFFIRCLLLSFFVAPAPEHLLFSRFSLFSFFFLFVI
jgi:hypothetical protein